MGEHLEFYTKYSAIGELPTEGLCNCGLNQTLLNLFEPTDYQYQAIFKKSRSVVFWAAGIDRTETNENEIYYEFTPLRQTIVLFMAAMNGEL